jgi:HEAT repeats
MCCTGGRTILFVGIEEQGSPALPFRSAPQGSIRLSDDVVQAGRDFDRAIRLAVLRGDAGEDDSKGHALVHDPTARAIQERFVVYATRDLRRLREVLHDSASEKHRSLAAEVLGYAPDKRAVIGELVYGMGDPSEEVRNNSMRALGIIGQFGSRLPALKIRVPTKPFVRLLNSLVWTDRNKASFALMELTGNRDPALFKNLRKQALRSLIEMARWKSDGHAIPAFWLLGRISGLPEDQIQAAASSRADRVAVIESALKRP